MKPDLTLLYSELGLKPDCSLAELQLACRRRISELQPHRLEGGSHSPESSVALRDLIGLYTTASRFHRRYGRLPGAAPRRPSAASPRYADAPRMRAEYSQPRSGDRQLPPPKVALGLAVMFLILLFGLLASNEWLR